MTVSEKELLKKEFSAKIEKEKPTVIIATPQASTSVSGEPVNKPSSPPVNQLTSQSSRNHPFVVQELTD